MCVQVFGNVKGHRVAVWTDSGHCCVCVCVCRCFASVVSTLVRVCAGVRSCEGGEGGGVH